MKEGRSRLEGALGIGVRMLTAFVVLLLLWWVARDVWASGFRAACNAVAWMVGASRHVEFRPSQATPGSIRLADTLVWLRGPDGALDVSFGIPSLRYSYVPLGVYASLLFATRRRDGGMRRGAELAGLLGVVAFIAFSVAVTVARMSILQAAPSARDAGTLGLAIELAYRVLVNAPAFEYVVPAFIWLATRAVSTREFAEPSRAERRRPLAR